MIDLLSLQTIEEESHYVQCKIKSKISVYDMKYGNMNIMNFLKDQNLFINIQKFKSLKEACIGFLSGHYPSSTLKSDLRKDIDRYLQEVKLTQEESTDLTQDPVEDENEMECKQNVLVPAYNMVSRNFGFDNGTDRIETHAMEIRCDPSNAIILKKIFTRISLNSKTSITLMPT